MGMCGYFIRISQEDLKEILANPKKIFDKKCDKNLLDIDKSWHGIHYLLTGSSREDEPPASWVILGDETKTIPINTGYGSPTYLLSDQVKEVAKFLSKVSQKDLYLKYNPDIFFNNNIYPNIWQEEDEAFEYLMDFYPELVEFYKKASTANECVIMYVA